MFVGLFSSVVLLLSGTNHNLVHGHLKPRSIILLLYVIVHWLCSNFTVHPASQSLTTDSNDCCFSCGMMCAVRDAAGKFGHLMSHSWADIIVFPSGIIMLSAFIVCLIFFTLAVTARKCPVVPESNMP